ncbi:MAG TPA: hypothetical protein VLK35_12230 [Methylomirabilota bacterium]|nr:hypothetical protein [Methylomirabilota bacterium]
MRAFCAWCQREGGPAFLGEREPLDDDGETHGVCRRHLQGILAALPSHSFPDVTYLFVIKPGETALYDYLERAFLGIRGVKIIMERRQAERREAPRRAAHERRRTDRRQPRGTSYALGYTTVRFGSSARAAGSAVAS